MENKNLVSTVGSSTERIEQPDRVINRYNGKRVRIDGILFVIDVEVGRKVVVWLNPMQMKNDGYSVNSMMNEDDFPNAETTIIKGIRLVNRIADEVEQQIPADFTEVS